MFVRSDERETAAAYEALSKGRGPSAVLLRFLQGPVGAFLVNTPVFLLQRRLQLTAHHRILDVGCGRAATLRFLTHRLSFDAAPVGIDISPDVIKRTHDEIDDPARIALAAAAATRLPFADASFDLVLCSYVVRHLSDIAFDRFLQEAWRVLRPGGVLLVWDFAPTRSSLLNRFHHWLLAPRLGSSRLRGYGDFVDLAVESSFANMEIFDLRPFLFPPIPRTGFYLRKGAQRPAAPTPGSIE